MTKEELYGQLDEAYHNYKPDAVDDDEDLAQEIEELDQLSPKTDSEMIEAVKRLAYFLGNWFPDEEDEEEQEQVRLLLEEAQKL